MAALSFSQTEQDRFTKTRTKFCTFQNVRKSAEEFIKETFEDHGEQQKFLRWYIDTSLTEVDEMFRSRNVSADALWASLRREILTDENSYELFRNIATNFADPVLIGTLANDDGTQTILQLSVDVFALSPTYRKGYAVDTKLDWGVGGALAIQYDTGDLSGKLEPVKPAELENRGTLVRFQDVGWIMIKEGSESKKTGHVLVLDPHRNFSPWLVLAPEWFDHDEGEIVEPQRTLKEGEHTAPGILPGDKHWVPVVKLEGNFSGEITTWFNEKAVFTMERSGSENVSRLPHIMEWYVDNNRDEVAYMKQDQEWYRYSNHRYIRTTSKPAPH
ncbi:hypothetical protein MMC27_003254 [Xylographa pallens]|nr:hypothetical protein [Xylographa pallens]